MTNILEKIVQDKKESLIEIKKASKEEIADVMIFNSLSFKENT